MTKRKARSVQDLVDRTLPHNIEAERSLLGAVLINNAVFEKARQHVGPRDFFRRAHMLIFGAFVTLIDEQKRDVDLVTLKEELGRLGELDECGGPAYIAALTDGVPRTSNVASYAQIVREQSRLRQIIKAGNEMMAAGYDAEESSADIVTAADKAIIALQRGHAGELRDLRETSQALYADIEFREQHKGQLVGVDTGFASINDLTLGWEAGELIVLAARPSIGKSAFMLHTAIAVARTGKTVGIFSLEMQRRQLERRLLASLSGLSAERLKSGYLGETDYEKLAPAMAEMAALPIYIDDRSAQNVYDIRAACRLMKIDHGLDFVVIDYVQLMAGALERRGATRTEEVTHISRGLKVLTGELEVPIFLLSQLNRGADNRADPRPKLSDLRESGSLEQDADKVVFLHRKHHRESGVTNVIIDKDRNGPGGTVNVTFNRDNQTFMDGGEEPTPAPAAEEKPKRKKRAPIFAR